MFEEGAAPCSGSQNRLAGSQDTEAEGGLDPAAVAGGAVRDRPLEVRIIRLNFIHMASMRKTPRSLARTASSRLCGVDPDRLLGEHVLTASVAAATIGKCSLCGVQV